MDRKLKALVFDFDGTLACLTLDFGLMKKRLGALAECYLDPAPAPDSLPALEWLDALRNAVESEHDLATALEFHTRGRFLIMDMELAAAREGGLFPGTRGMLRRLREDGVRSGIVTRNCAPALRQVFPDAREFCDVVLTREDVARVKPHPEHLLRALETLGVAPEKSLMVGDHPMDIVTGRAAGARTAGVGSGGHSLDELGREKPDYLAADCGELVVLLEGEGLL